LLAATDLGAREVWMVYSLTERVAAPVRVSCAKKLGGFIENSLTVEQRGKALHA